MVEVITSYCRMQRAIQRAEAAGYEVNIYTDYILLQLKGNILGSPAFHFYTPEEIHCYLNGVEDGKSMVKVKKRKK